MLLNRYDFIVETKEHILHLCILVKMTEIPCRKLCIIRHTLKILSKFHFIIRHFNISYRRNNLSRTGMA